MHSKIQEKIQRLMIDNPKTASGLQDQVNSLQATSYTKDEAKTLMFSEDDYLELAGEIEEGTELWIDVRDLQNDICECYYS